MISIEQAWHLVCQHESRGQLDAIGDDGMAGGAGQMWWSFRRDYWPTWAWNVLEALDAKAFRNFVLKHPGLTLRELYEQHYNPHGSAPDLPAEPISGS